MKGGELSMYLFFKTLHMFVTGKRIDKIYHFEEILNLSYII